MSVNNTEDTKLLPTNIDWLKHSALNIKIITLENHKNLWVKKLKSKPPFKVGRSI